MDKQETAMPIVAGILDIIHAVFGLICLFGLVIAIANIAIHDTTFPWYTWGIEAIPLAILWSIAIPCAIISILSLVGGIFAILRRNWGLALAGSIAAMIPTFVTGIPAVILMALSKNEFK